MKKKKLIPDEEKHRYILANMEDGYYEVDLKGDFTFVNPSACLSLGRDATESIGMNYRQCIAPQSMLKIEETFKTVYRTGAAAKIIEYELVQKDGTRRTHEMSVSLLRQPTGEPLGFFGITRDRTDALRQENALRASEASYRGVMDLCPDVISINAFGTDRYVDVNKAFTRQLGYSADEVMGRSLEELNLYASPEDRRRLGRAVLAGDVNSLEVRFRAKDGTILDYLVSNRRIHFKSRDCYLFVATLITPLKEAHKALRESEESYRRLMELAPDAITISRLADGKYFEVNDTFCHQTGYRREEVIGRTVIDLNIYADVEDRKRVVAALRQNGRVDGMEIVFRARDGTLLTDLVSARIMTFKNEECVIVIATVINALKEAQKELAESEGSYRTILDTAPYSVSITCPKTNRYLLVNEAFCRNTGYTRQETIGHTARELHLYEDPAGRRQFINLYRQQGCVDGMEIRFRRKDGVTTTSLISARPIHFRGKTCVLAVTTNIDALKKVQSALEESEESYRKVIQTTPNAIAVTRRSDGRIIEVNDAFSLGYGYSHEESVGRTVLELNLYADPEDDLKIAEALKSHGQLEGLEIRLRARDGKIRQTLLSITPLRYRGEESLLLSGVDVTVLKEYQTALHESEETYRRILESAPYSIIVTRLSDLCFVEVNDSFCRRTGYSRKEVIDRSPLELGYMSSEDWSRLLHLFNAQGRVDSLEIQFRAKNGRLITNLLSSIPIRFHGEDCMLTMTVDITPRKRAEQELAQYRQHLEDMVQARTQALEEAQNELVKREKLAVLGQLTATVSHELRNPLGVIRSSNFFLQRKITERDEKIEKHFRRIEEQVALCDAIVADLLEYTRGRSVSMVKEDLTPWLIRVIEQLQESQGLPIARELAGPLPVVPHDPEKMRRVLINVLDNAIQAVKTRLSTENAALSGYHAKIAVKTYFTGDRVVIDIQDNGIGMAPETLQRAFEPLFTTRARGTGIGLAIVKKVVNEHGGDVFLESTLGEGTRVTITLPCAAPSQSGKG